MKVGCLPRSQSERYLSFTMRALIIEDDRKAAQLLAKGLREERFAVDLAHSASSGDELARIHALLRRSGLTRPVVLEVADLTLDPRSHRVARGGQAIDVTPKEYAILEVLMRSKGQAVSRSDLAQRVWETDQDSFSNLVDVHISHLRRKIDPPGAVPLIHTVRGRGFLLGPTP